MNEFISVIKQYAVFSGRARRKEYWMFYLIYMVIYLALFAISFAAAYAGSTTIAGIIGGLNIIFALAMFLPGLGVTVRRLHDTGRSGWMFLIALIPLVGAILLLIWNVSDSQPGNNAYGANPKGVNAPAAA